MDTIYRIVACAIAVIACCSFAAYGDEPAATLAAAPLSGTVQASLDHNEASGTWRLYLNGSFEGDGVRVANMQLLGMNADGDQIGTQQLDMSMAPAESPFAESFQFSQPDPDWSEIGVELKLTDAQGSITVRSSPFPIIWQRPILIDHAIKGSIVTAPNYSLEYSDIPPGIGIPHTLINSLPEGNYYAVVFFDGAAHGCPTDNYMFNSFIPGGFWGEDGNPNNIWSKGFDTAGGGCMQQMHVDPKKGGDWLWGAISNTGTSSAIADADGIPAFAICATRAACDPIMPHGAISAPEEGHGTTTPLVSNVLFLPGIKGSDLYEDNPLCLIPSDGCGIKVWLPLADAMVPELFLDAEGKSRRNIFVREGELLGSAFNQHFYDSFTAMLDDSREKGTFGTGWDWKAGAYDWRLSLPDIIHNGVNHGSHIYFSEPADEPYLERTLRSLASSSPTGKVTIIAHSNGGLVAKALMQSLGDTLSAELIDSVVFVGVPQSGAPRALGALLYGDAEGIPGIPRVPNFIMSAAHAREFGLNSPMAYHLLPSNRYMSALQPEHPVVKFEDDKLLEKERAAYGQTIDTETELQSFALAKEGARSMPAADDLNSANILRPSLFAYALDEHALLDPWEPPASIEIYELGGYGAGTISGIDLYQSTHRDGSAAVSYRPLFTSDGDGTVPLISALMMNASSHVHHFMLDLAGMRGALSYSHANLLEAPDVQAAIESILQRSAVLPSTVHAMEMPASQIARKQFGFFVHSPVSIAVTDGSGKTTSVGDSGTEEGIVGSTAGTFGEVKYVLIPSDDPPYTLALAGEGDGSFTLDLQELENDVVTASSTIADVPVTESTRAMLSLSAGLRDASPLSVDESGDGTAEFSIPIALASTTFPVSEQPSAAAPSSSAGRTSAPQLLPAAVPRHIAPIAEPITSKDIPRRDTPAIRQAKPEPAPVPHRQIIEQRATAQHPSLLSKLRSLLREGWRIMHALLKTLGGLPRG